MLCQIRFIPQRFEPGEMKKVRLQEVMSGLKHDFSIENMKIVRASSSQSNNDDVIDPVDECNT